ncbi:MAG TPA: YggS family pyridoxal phosphate-dependent enzyme [Phycisphaerales bacterium]|nr:YggS family pyridoxal phosphate-dependent enzyme [Phycisphaerales bacterium]HMP37532.1 YggS family pyridoxal phosphate-dependent enzyme [Phycisphaerales bacterium]
MVERTPSRSPLLSRYDAVRARIVEASLRSGRRPSEVTLVAVSKSATPEQIVELACAGHRDFGENRVQLLAERVAQLGQLVQPAGLGGELGAARERPTRSGPRPAETSQGLLFGPEAHSASESVGPAPDVAAASATLAETTAPPPSSRRTESAPFTAGVLSDARWHLIGPLQRNKVRKAIELSSLIHSVENLRQAEAIHEEAMSRDTVAEVLVQVNVAGEKAKHGMNARAVPAVVEQLETMAGLEVRGLMCMAPLVDDPESVRPIFEQCRELFDELRRADGARRRFDTLSMGMSNDFEVAIECGATMLRVGSAIFAEA